MLRSGKTLIERKAKVCIILPWSVPGTDMHGAQRMNPEDFGAHLTFTLASLAGSISFGKYLLYLCFIYV